MDQNMKKLLVLIGCLVALLVICVVVVGMIDGFWPWQNQTEDGTTLESTTLDDSQTTQDTLDTTQDTTGEATQDTTEETGGNEGNNSGSNSGGNSGSNSGSNSGGSAGGTSDDWGDIEIGIDGGEDTPVVTQPDNTENQDTKYTGDADGVIDFDDLKKKS